MSNRSDFRPKIIRESGLAVCKTLASQRRAEQRRQERSRLSASSRRISDEALSDMTTDEISGAYERGLLGDERWYAAATRRLDRY